MGLNGLQMSAGVIVIRLGDSEPRYLLLRAFRYWDFPKGAVEAGEQPVEAARREVREETGITDLSFRWGTAHYDTPPYRSGRKFARYFLAESPGDHVQLQPSAELGRAEHHEFRWTSVDEARRLLVPRVRAALDWADAIVRTDRPLRDVVDRDNGHRGHDT